MSPREHPVVYWTPRIVGILMTLFLALFAADVFSEGHGFFETALALLMHLVPALVVLAVVLVAWRHELVGGIFFLALATFYLVWTWGRFPWSTYVVISGPLALAGVLFLVGARQRRTFSGRI